MTTPSPTAAASEDPREAEVLHLLAQAGEEAMRQRAHLDPAKKADGSLVTDADRACEALLVRGLQRLFPDDGIVGEEGALCAPRAGAGTWYVDPIDGTSSYIAGLGHWGPTMFRALPTADGPAHIDLGGFIEPSTHTRWFASAGRGAWRNGARLRPAPPGPLHDAMCFMPSGVHKVGPIGWPGRARILGSTAAHLAHVASGGAAAALVHSWKPWDIGCGVLLVFEAGRDVVPVQGNAAIDVTGPPRPILAGHRSAFPPLLASLKTLARP